MRSVLNASTKFHLPTQSKLVWNKFIVGIVVKRFLFAIMISLLQFQNMIHAGAANQCNDKADSTIECIYKTNFIFVLSIKPK